MVKHNLHDYYNGIEKALAERRYSVALSLLESMGVAGNAPWDVKSEISQIAESYGLLSHYAFSGADDPSRREQLESLCGRILTVATQMLRIPMIDDSHKQYFSVLRYLRSEPAESISKLLVEYRRRVNNLGLRKLAGKVHEDAYLKEIHQLEKRVFETVWTTFPFSREDETALVEACRDSAISAEMLNLLASAVMLGALEYYDERRHLVLGRFYLEHRKDADVKALCALLISLWINRDKPYGVRFHKLFDTMVEDSAWEADFRTVFMAMARTHDTKRITRTMTEDILPELVRLQPKINKLMSEADKVMDINNMEENPEWEDMVEKSGLGKKLQALNELQMSGADVMMSTFSSLKSFPFFSEPVNWFRDFNPDSIDDSSSLPDDLNSFIASAPMLCDNDKYSLLLCVQSMGADQRKMLLGQMQAQMEQNAELALSLLNPQAASRAQLISNYVQSLYRFFELYRRKGEFKNPFASPINLVTIDLLGAHVHDEEAVRLVAEFYFKYGYYTESVELYELLLNRGCNDAQIYQKTGYCYQRLGKMDQALDMYLKAEILAPDSMWTLRRIAHCYRIISQPAKALEYYERVAAQRADDINLTLSIGHCLMELERYHDAMRQYFKVEYLAAESGKHLRPMAWCSLMLGDVARAEKYFNKIKEAGMEDADYLNAGHLYMVKGDIAQAIELYGKSSLLTYAASMAIDRGHLERLGVDPVLIDLVIDKVLSENQL